MALHAAARRVAMKFRHVPPRQGVRWVVDGLRVFMRKPLAFCVLFLIYLLIGPMVMLAVSPLATVGFMIATRQALAGRFPFPGVFIEPLQASRAQRWAQVKLGLAYAVAVALVLWISDSVGGAAFEALREAVREGRTDPQELEPILDDSSLQSGWLLAALGMALVAIPFWHAPALVHWGGHGAAQSLFFSVVACWRNKGALLVYSLGWGAVILVFAFVSTTVFALLGVPQLAVLFFMPAVLMLSSAFYASLYFTFADSFEPTAEPAVAEAASRETS
ncbi:MAG TPA: BPSS1780 family membrane protein [Albitalea sp.]